MIKAYKFGLAVTENDFSTDDIDAADEWTLVDFSEISDDSFDNEDETRIRLSCFAHSLQLAIRDGLKDTPYLSKCLSKCTNK
jgi:hypothetical protein